MPPKPGTVSTLLYWIKVNSERQNGHKNQRRSNKKPDQTNPFMRPKDTRQAVYFMLVGDTVKIGISRNLNRRIKEFKVAISAPIDAVYVESGVHFTEKELHERFAQHRLQGEWFSLSDEIKGFVDDCFRDAMLTRFHLKGDLKG